MSAADAWPARLRRRALDAGTAAILGGSLSDVARPGRLQRFALLLSAGGKQMILIL